MHNLFSQMMYPELPEREGILEDLRKACRKNRQDLYVSAARQILSFGAKNGLTGNLWQAYLTYALVTDDNPVMCACSLGRCSGTMEEIALSCARVWHALFHWDFAEMDSQFGPFFAPLLRMEGTEGDNAQNEPLRTLCRALAQAESPEAFLAPLKDFAARNGFGQSSLRLAFRVTCPEPLSLEPITQTANVTFDDLIGYEKQKQAMRENVEAFLSGSPYNHMLLYGDAGTGKSTSVKALLHMYASRGLRLVEVRKHQLAALEEIIRLCGEHGNHYIIYMDDLSFEENETGYKSLKAVMEGGIAEEKSNVLLLATSNRRHLVREDWKDRSDMEHEGDVHRSDTLEEKLSLAARFGCAVQFSIPSVKDFDRMVWELYRRQGGKGMEEETIRRRAYAFEIRHGGVSGRTAQQFVNVLLSEERRAD